MDHSNPSAAQKETRRLEALRSLDILDTPPEIDFDELTKLAALICKMPIAVISLVDENRQWFKSKLGLDAQQTARNISFCTHAIEQSEVLIVEDALRDERFCNNPLVQSDPRIRFYAGAPLRLENGVNLGTLCVIDREARSLDAQQIEALSCLANQVINLIRARDMHRNLQLATLRLKNLIDAQPSGILVEDRDGRVRLANHSFYTLFKVDPDQSLVGASHRDWCVRVSRQTCKPAEFDQLVGRLLSEGQSRLSQIFQLSDDRWFEMDYVPMSVNGAVDSHLWKFRDVTDRKRAE